MALNGNTLGDAALAADTAGGLSHSPDTKARARARWAAVATIIDAEIADALGPGATLLASNANGEGASLVGIEDAATRFTGTDAETALAECATVAELASVANGLGASLIGIEDAATLYAAADVEAALAEVKLLADAAAPSADLASTDNALGASLIGLEDAATLYTATDVEGALAEVRPIANAALPLASIRRMTASLGAEGADVIIATVTMKDGAGATAAAAKPFVAELWEPTGELALVGSATIGLNVAGAKGTLQSTTGNPRVRAVTDADGTAIFDLTDAAGASGKAFILVLTPEAETGKVGVPTYTVVTFD